MLPARVPGWVPGYPGREIRTKTHRCATLASTRKPGLGPDVRFSCTECAMHPPAFPAGALQMPGWAQGARYRYPVSWYDE
eukprot:2741152-Rhodomonas_salina.2